MTLVRWNPFRDMESMLNAVSSDVWGNEQLATADWRPNVDIRETDTGFLIGIDVPAVDPKDIQVSVKDRILTVSGERKHQSEHKDAKVHRIERSYGRFSRSFVLPENANPESIEAASKDGVLHLTINKREGNRPRAIEVKSA